MEFMDLKECRDQLDQIDQQIVELFEQRMQVCADVAAYKINTGKEVYDEEREQQKLAAIEQIAHGGFNRVAVRELFSQMMTISRRYQYQLLEESGQQTDLGFEQVDHLDIKQVRVVYQGVEGAYSHAAVRQYFGTGVDAYHVPLFKDAMQAVSQGDADYAVLPIENSSAGAVIDNYDLLTHYHNYIVGEIFILASHTLLVRPEAELADIRTVYSHPQALMQCSAFLNSQRDWRQVSCENTAVAAKKVMEDQDNSQAAVASAIAGQLYGLKVLKESIQNNQGNTTRFIILSRKPIYRREAGKISLVFELPHTSGSLYNILGNFIFNNVNMRMIESRPIQGRNWEYRFFIDMEGNLDDAGIRNALRGIAAESQNMRILGNY
ncbi:MAG: prephenate dehydratase [Lachnospiraceae bacterium]